MWVPARRGLYPPKGALKGDLRSDPADGRRRLVQLTHDGHELARALVAVGPDISSETLDGLSAAERRDLLRLLDRLGRKG